ncbi:TPA: flavodoxin [Candidatus Poribacteria bacterium]|nr:flavodoxin [Candidatus Poribacteria bacterium]
MRALVIYDTNFGNTKIIAEAIAKELGSDAKAVSVSDFDIKELEGIELLVVGSPIIGWRPSERMGKFLASLNKDQLKGVKSATYDTRVKVFFHGDASRKIAKKLEDAGAEIIDKPQAFFVKGKEGPLLDGEVEKATEWAKRLKG